MREDLNARPKTLETSFQPRPKQISDHARWAYGVLAALSPLSLLLTLVLAGGHAILGDAGSTPTLAVVVGIYQVIGTAMLVVFFGHDMLSQRGLSSTSRQLWAAGFLCMAPVALPLYWLAYLRPDSSSRRARLFSGARRAVVVKTLPALQAA